MATMNDVRRIALSLPQVSEREGEHPSWRVRTKLIVWDRPLRHADRDHLGESAPDGGVVGIRVADLDVKEELLSLERPVVFTTPHFNGYPSVLVRLEDASVELLEELITEAWLVQAPKRLAQSWLDAND